jgi:hypothetical protein
MAVLKSVIGLPTGSAHCNHSHDHTQLSAAHLIQLISYIIVLLQLLGIAALPSVQALDEATTLPDTVQSKISARRTNKPQHQ